MEKKKYRKIKWLKRRNYLHITNKLNTRDDEKAKRYVLDRVNNPNFVEKYAFFPLLFKQQNVRKIKNVKENPTTKKDKISHRNKPRPIHYATHLDAHIYAKYSFDLQKKYEKYLKKCNLLNDCVIGYRAIKNTQPKPKRKHTAIMAKEVFDEIKKRGNAVILTFDIKKFFSSLDHSYLKKQWLKFAPKESSNQNILRKDHYHIFKAVTKFHYININELKTYKGGFDERKLAEMRANGVNALFESAEDFRNQIKKGNFHIYKNQFRRLENDKKIMCGIPQGLPISANLANIYMVEFDEFIIKNFTKTQNVFYRRYSDDMIFVCAKENYEMLKNEIEAQITNICKLKIAKEKTEVFFYKDEKITNEDLKHKNKPLRYLGLEFDGKRILIKSASISKFYRNMKKSINSKIRIVNILKEKNYLQILPPIFKNRIYKRFLLSRKVTKKETIKTPKSGRKKQSNLVAYIKRIANDLQEKGILRQIRNRFKICKKYLKNKEI